MTYQRQLPAMLNKSFFAFLLTLFSCSAYAQFGSLEPVTWGIETQATDAEGEVDIVLKATVEDGWYLYSKETEDGGPIQTRFDFGKADGFELIGEVIENAEKTKEGHDDIFDMNVKKLIGNTEFRQRVKITDPTKFISGELLFQTCDDGQCLPPTDIPFAVKFTDNSTAIGEQNVSAFLGKKEEILAGGDEGPQWTQYDGPQSDCTDTDESKSWLGFLLWGIVGGLTALFMPCTFPMIPLTVSFFTKRHENKRKGKIEAVLYGFFIFLIFLGLGLPILILKPGADIYNLIATDPLLNVGFFVIFVVFAISFFGFFEITLPSGLANKTDKASNLGGVVGIFFMALTLLIVSFSCTGPILASIITLNAVNGGTTAILTSLAGFGLGLGIPFALFALFPGIMKSLPKSGGWMNTFKVILGFVELIFAFKFLSNADLVKQWGILPKEVFLGIWLLLAILMALHLFGIFSITKYGPEKRSLVKAGIGVLALVFGIYLIPGITKNANLNLLSGFPPPGHYSLAEKGKSDSNSETVGHEFKAFTSIEEAVAHAEKVNKPILIDFTGWACVNCRKMEENVWIKPGIEEILKNDVVLASLYVDDRTKLGKSEMYRSKATKRKVNTIGKKWSDFEITSFDKPSQPYYAMVTPDGKLMNSPVGYTQAEEFEYFLECGLTTYANLEKN